METDIINILKRQDTDLKTIIKLLKEKYEIEDNEIISTISNLIKEHKIFLNERNKYVFITDEYVVGTLQSCSKELKYVKYNKDKIIIHPENTHTALVNDLVVVKLLNGNTGSVVGIINRKNNKLVCEVIVKNNKLKLVPFNGNKEINVYCDKEALNNFIEGDRVYVEINNKPDFDNTIVANEIIKLGHFNDEMNDEIAIAISKDFDIDFSKEALDEANNIPNIISDEELTDRLDLRNEKIFTIDSVKTKDMDDAISIKKLYNENYLVSVHIADVAHYIKPNSYLFKDALRRGTSVYLGNVVIPMIPSILSNGICSLNEGVDRLTKSVIMEVNQKGKVIKSKIVDSVINSKKKMTYEELNELFDGKEIDSSYYPFLNDINLAKEVSDILTKTKHKKGHLNFESSDIEIERDDDNIPIKFEHRDIGVSQKIIENLMILANETVADYFYWQELPFVYRVHNNPDELKLEDTIELINNLGYKLVRLQNAYGQKAIQNILEDYKDKPEYTIISNLLLRNMAKAKYSTHNIGHYALASDNYCHFTSPIRRFPDLIVHSLIDMFINNNKQSKAILENLEEICEHSSYKERQSDKAENDYIKLKMAEYMKDHINEEFEGIILDIDKENVYIKLNNNIKGILDLEAEFIEAFNIDTFKRQLKCKHSKQELHLGTKIKATVTKVDIPQKEIYFDIKEIVKNHENKHTKKLELINND